MWICCITVHIVSDQIFGNRLFLFPFLCEYYSRVRSVEKLNIILTTMGKKNAWTFWFCLKPFELWGFFLHQGGKKHLNIFDDEIVLFSTCRRSVAGLLEECYRMWFRWMLKRYDEAFLSLCLYALIFLPRTCVCVYECVAWLLPVKLTCWRSTSTKHFLLLLRRKKNSSTAVCLILIYFFLPPCLVSPSSSTWAVP